MIRLLQWLWFGHLHEWKERNRLPLDLRTEGEITDRGTRVECVCKTCGEHRKFDLI